MSLHTLDCNHWRLSRWQRLSEWVRDRLPPGWPAMVASFVLLIVLAVEVLRPDIVWRVFA